MCTWPTVAGDNFVKDRSAKQRSEKPEQLEGRRHRQDMTATTCLDGPEELKLVWGAYPDRAPPR